MAKPDERIASAPVVVVGGGIAGLSAAWQLGTLGVRDVVLLEAEPMLATHASARNAAIFLPLEESLNAVWLATRSRDLLDARLGTSWLSAQGVALVSGYTEPLDQLRYAARRYGTFHERWSALQIESRLPMLRDGDAHHALFLPLGGVIDIHMVLSSLARFARALGAQILTSAKVRAIELGEGQVRGVTLDDGHRIATENVVIAAGAFSAQLTDAFAPLDLVPLRRHLVLLGGREMPRWKTPVVWRVDDSPVYFRPESGLLLASPCDEEPSPPGRVTVDDAVLESLADKIAQLAPALADADVRRIWACQRTMAEDREPVVGPDPRIGGLHWLCGLGGRGMTCGVAAGELLARTMTGLPHPLARHLSPARLT